MNLDSPYKGLDAFDDSDVDALLFFGREREREIVVANLIASRLTVFYGPTGVGKSSLLRAAVARSLRELPEEPLVVLFDRWGDDPTELSANVADILGDQSVGGLYDVVEQAQRSRDVYLILDQVEEYFVYQEDEVPFEEELARVVGEPLRVNVLLSLREDSLAELDRFKRRIPFIYANSLRLDRLDRAAARAAITGPVERWNELTGEHVDVEPELVEAVLDGVGAGQIESAAGGLGSVEGNGRPYAVEAPYLQLVMQRLWEVERAAASAQLRAGTLEELGGARRVVAEHLERAVEHLTLEERDVAARLFTYLVTPSGTKIAHALPDLAEYADIDEAAAAPVVATLSKHRILRPDEAGRTEIFHDVLAGEVLAWRRRHHAEHELERARDDARRRHRRLAWLAGGALAGFLLMSLLAVFALSQRSEARAQAREARAHQLEAVAAAGLEADPERSLLLALEAARLAPSESGEETLRTALRDSHVRAVVDVGQPLLGAVLRGRALAIGTSTGTLVVADARSGTQEREIGSRKRARHVSFAEDGTALFTMGGGTLRLIRSVGEVSSIPGGGEVARAEISPDGSLAVLIGDRMVRLIDARTGAVRRTLPHRGAISAAISPSNTRVVTGAADGSIRVWVVPTGRMLRSLPPTGWNPIALAFSPDASLLAAASSDGVARIWRVATGDIVVNVTGDATSLLDVSFSTDGAHVATTSRDGTVRVSKSDTGATLLAFSGHDEAATSAAFSGPAGSSVVTASMDGTARIWDALYQPELKLVARLPGRVTALAVDDDDRVHATAGSGARVVDLRSGKTIGKEPGTLLARSVVGPDGTTAAIRLNTVILEMGGRRTVLKGHRDRVRAVAFSPDGALVATASRDRDVRIWDPATGQSLRTLEHNSEVRDVAFSPDSRWLVSAAGRAALWDPRTGALVVRLQGHEGPVTAVRFDSSGGTIVTGGVDGTVRAYRCDLCGELDQLIALAERRLAATGRELTPDERERYLG